MARRGALRKRGTAIRLQGFKSWRDTGGIRMAPLTASFGANSSGKTAILQMLLALKQTAESADRSRVLHTGDEQSYVELGTLIDIVHGHQDPREVSFELSWALPKPLQVADFEAKPGEMLFAPNVLTFRTTMRSQADDVSVADFAYRFGYDQKQYSFGMRKTASKGGKSAYKLEAAGLQPKRTRGRAWPLPAPEKSYGFPDQVNACFQNMGFVSQVVLAFEDLFGQVCYLGPLRDYPQSSPCLGGAGSRATSGAVANSPFRLCLQRGRERTRSSGAKVAARAA